MGYLRFVVGDDHPDTGVAAGVFTLAYRLRDNTDMSAVDRLALAALLRWFSDNLPIPERFNRSSSKGYYRRNTRGIAWFRDDAREHLRRMHELRAILEANGYSIEVVQERRVGYVVYEDPVQVIAEPFADTKTGP